MSGIHESPCPGLKTTQEDLRGQGHTIKGHERELGGIAETLKRLLDGQAKLFDRTDDLCKDTERQRISLKSIEEDQAEIKHAIGNGLKDDIASKVLEAIKETIGFGARTEVSEKRDQAPEIHTFTDFLNYGFWQLIHQKAWVLPAILIFVLFWFLIWGGAKWGIFGEIPFPKIPPIQGQ